MTRRLTFEEKCERFIDGVLALGTAAIVTILIAGFVIGALSLLTGCALKEEERVWQGIPEGADRSCTYSNYDGNGYGVGPMTCIVGGRAYLCVKSRVQHDDRIIASTSCALVAAISAPPAEAP